jgi:hypothetical protein
MYSGAERSFVQNLDRTYWPRSCAPLLVRRVQSVLSSRRGALARRWAWGRCSRVHIHIFISFLL